MALRKIWKLSVFSTKAGLAGGSVFYFYETGLWKGSEDTIKNYAKLRSDVTGLYESSPELMQLVSSTRGSIKSVTEPYCKAVSDFRKEWLNFDLWWLTTGVKPVWNKGVIFTTEILMDSPESLKSLSVSGWNKVKEMLTESSEKKSDSGTSGKSSPAIKQ